jgi:chromosomal replication initiator protein
MGRLFRVFTKGDLSPLSLEQASDTFTDAGLTSLSRCRDKAINAGVHGISMFETWGKALEILKNRIDPVQFEMWFNPIRLTDHKDGHLLLEVPDEFFARWIQDNYLEIIKDALWDTAHRPIGIDFRVKEVPTPVLAPSTPEPAVPPVVVGDRMLPSYTFDNFVIGPSNEIAHSACELVAANPGSAYNPLFIYGGVGLGKTHLLQAIGHSLRARAPHLKVLYTFGESFVNEVMTAVKNHRLDALRYRYRGQCDVLLMDDIQYLADRDFAQEEFFYTFNELYNGQKQIVVTTDQVPTAIPGFSDRMRSRFAWGLMVDVAPPEHDLRIRILNRKAGREGLELPGDVAEFLAGRFTGSVRELEGALNRVAAHALIRKMPLGLDLARRVSERIVDDRRGRITIDVILKSVAEHFNLLVADIKSPRRHRAVSTPRQIAVLLIRKHTGASLPQIGAALGGRSHTTIISSLEHINGLIESDASTRRAYQDIERRLGLG